MVCVYTGAFQWHRISHILMNSSTVAFSDIGSDMRAIRNVKRAIEKMDESWNTPIRGVKNPEFVCLELVGIALKGKTPSNEDLRWKDVIYSMARSELRCVVFESASRSGTRAAYPRTLTNGAIR
jgi:hypothetical protein